VEGMWRSKEEGEIYGGQRGRENDKRDDFGSEIGYFTATTIKEERKS